MTGLELCTDAATELGVYAGGEPLSASDAQLLLRFLRRLFNGWNADRRAVYATSFLTFTIPPPIDPAIPITIGPTGDWVTDSRPVSIDGANLVLTTSTPSVQLPIHIRDHQWWLGQSVPTLTTDVPTDLYYQPDWPDGKCFFWPVPSVAYDVALMVRVLLDEAVTLASDFTLPPGYQQAITLTLADMAMRAFGVPLERVPTLRTDASQARALIFGNNDQIPHLRTEDAGMTPGSSGRRADFNWISGAVL